MKAALTFVVIFFLINGIICEIMYTPNDFKKAINEIYDDDPDAKALDLTGALTRKNCYKLMYILFHLFCIIFLAIGLFKLIANKSHH